MSRFILGGGPLGGPLGRWGDRARPRRSLHIYRAHARGLRTEAGAHAQRSQVNFQIERWTRNLCRAGRRAVFPRANPSGRHAPLCAKNAVSSRHPRGPAPALRAFAAGPEGASLTLRFSPQCSLQILYWNMIRAFRDMWLVGWRWELTNETVSLSCLKLNQVVFKSPVPPAVSLPRMWVEYCWSPNFVLVDKDWLADRLSTPIRCAPGTD